MNQNDYNFATGVAITFGIHAAVMTLVKQGEISTELFTPLEVTQLYVAAVHELVVGLGENQDVDAAIRKYKEELVLISSLTAKV